MADGGCDDLNEPLITHGDDNDNDDENLNEILQKMRTSREEWEKRQEALRKAREELSKTQPFRPGQTSTPYHGGEQVGMQTTMQEESGGPSYAETSFGGEPTIDEISSRLEKLKRNETTGILDITDGIPNLNDAHFVIELQKEQKERAIRFIKNRYPNFNEKELKIKFSKKNPAVLVTEGPMRGETKIFLNNGSDFQQEFLNKTYVKNALGKSSQSRIEQASADISKMQKKRDEMRREQARAFEAKEVKEKEELDLKRRIRVEEEKRQQLHDDPEADKKLLEQKDALIKNLKKDLKTKQKESAQLQKNYDDSQKKTQKIGELNTNILQEEQTRDSLERRLNSTRSFDLLKEQEKILFQKNEEDQAIINDDDAAEMDKEAAQERIVERNEELARLQTQIMEREEAMPLRERIKEIFKKHGVTLTAIVIAAGVTIGAVVSSITKGLKATGKAMAGGLKELAAKLGSLLPGLIGQVASFLFNTAAKAVGFLAEHTWLIILAVVAFLFEKYIKKRR